MKLLVTFGACMALAPLATAFAGASAQDTMFVQQAALGGMTEIEAGHLATAQASEVAVKQFGQTMVEQHTANNQQLIALAKSKGLSVPTDLDAADKAALVALQKTTGSTFDATYIKNQIAGHTAMEQVMKTEIQTGTDPDLKTFAETTLPVVQDHLKMAQALLPNATP